MTDFYTNIVLILLLIVINGFFSMSEMSVVSSTKARLQKLISERRWGAKAALALHDKPTHFLSTVQVGITAVGILSGALGEEVLRTPLHEAILTVALLAPYAETLALILTVSVITYFSVVLGELVPKHLALQNPEAIAATIAKPMQGLSLLVRPLVWLLSASSHVLLRLLRMHRTQESGVSDEDIRIMMEMGSESGAFHASESQLVNNVMKMDGVRVGAIMVPRQEIYTLDLLEEADKLRSKIESCPYNQIVVCRGGFENVLGILHCGELLKVMLSNPEFNIEKELRPLFYVQETMTLTCLLSHFREAQSDLALIVNEYGDIEGLVTVMDILIAIVGELPSIFPKSGFEVTQRPDGSWLIDGDISITQLKSAIGINGQFPGESSNAYHTLAGMILFNLERLPQLAEIYETEAWRFEIVDLDGSRIDKVLISPNLTSQNEDQSA
ncbi:hemolysin family protein [Candidatus Methylobacter oryzae]|uniref:HlyC/CorC family transporter n=1 Tax=Candidatus Methylobacter oryzae TaxID=2497749 RepID=A0ABY3C540_9GAMM|nr:hemolysin family protein [Candidatus Methylobacter oryzae]TRW89976.1 HlyC/CorC family transporter [Candidatus Methylobacter oryzae]